MFSETRGGQEGGAGGSINCGNMPWYSGYEARS